MVKPQQSVTQKSGLLITDMIGVKVFVFCYGARSGMKKNGFWGERWLIMNIIKNENRGIKKKIKQSLNLPQAHVDDADNVENGDDGDPFLF